MDGWLGISNQFRQNAPRDNPAVPEWNGDPENIPEAYTPFMFKGKEYYWIPCPCCNLPWAFDADDEESYELLVRLRGKKLGLSLANVLVKAGKVEELIATGAKPELLQELFLLTFEPMEWFVKKDEEDKKAFLAEKGIPDEEWEEAIYSATQPLEEEEPGSSLIIGFSSFE
jgi:hypothetical protein